MDPGNQVSHGAVNAYVHLLRLRKVFIEILKQLANARHYHKIYRLWSVFDSGHAHSHLLKFTSNWNPLVP